AAILVLLGLWILIIYTNIVCFYLGIAALFWYNILYTPLKRFSSLAVIPGSVIGSIPPIIGWAAAGGDLLDPTIVFLALFVFIWQIPHFWLLLLIYNDEYSKADYPTLTNIIGPVSLKRLTFIWIVALVTCGVIIPYFSFTKELIVLSILFILGLILIFRSKRVLTETLDSKGFFAVFTELNIYVLVVLLVLSVNRLLN
ncbi:MAG: UbiA family prenyltransferase, partial [Candidatus Kapabacteria bacterium]|nr:UbiA family prenyltransferase [Candidatus Kapabacteria bacterium]